MSRAARGYVCRRLAHTQREARIGAKQQQSVTARSMQWLKAQSSENLMY